MYAIFTHFLAFLFLITVSSISIAETWSAPQFKAEIGNVVSLDSALTLTSNPNGQILVSVPASGLPLRENYRVSFKFAGHPPAQIFLVWRVESSQELFQKGFRSTGESELSFDLTDVRGWDGKASSLEFGFLVQPGQKIDLLEIRAFRPGLSEKVRAVFESWLEFKPWRFVDINVHTGTSQFLVGPYPAQVFAVITLSLVFLYCALWRRKSKPQSIALIIFCSWLILDSFWQLRLWRQVTETRVQYAGKTSEAKVAASEDALFAKFAVDAAARITRPDARVFVAGMQDYQAMVSAYYLSPINTYWHRHGPELPDAKYLKPGDFIFLLRASAINYQPTLSTLQLASGDQLKVKEHVSNPLGALLEVLE